MTRSRPAGHLERSRQSLVGRPLVSDLREEQLVASDRRSRRRSGHQERVDCVPEGETVGLVGVHVELADGHRQEVRNHRLDRVPGPCAGVAGVLLVNQHAIRDGFDARRHRDRDRDGGLVARMVVDREPELRNMRFADHDRPVIRRDEARAAEFLQGLRHTVVTRHDRELGTVGDPRRRLDGELLTLPRRLRADAIYRKRAQPHSDEIEVERGQVLGGRGLDRGLADQHVSVRVVADVEVVVLDVIAAVAVEREVRVADPGGTGRERSGWRGERDPRRQQRDGEELCCSVRGGRSGREEVGEPRGPPRSARPGADHPGTSSRWSSPHPIHFSHGAEDDGGRRGRLEPDSIYKSDAARAAIEALYDRALARLPFPTESRRVETTFGSTHVLVAGPEGAPPLLALQGGNVVNPLTLAWLTPLAGEFRIYAPDTIGQPGKSSGRRMSANDASLGEWCEQVLDGLGLEAPAFVAISYGAGILLRLAALRPARIGSAALVVPAGIADVPLGSMLTLAAGYVSFLAIRRPGLVEATVKRLAGPNPDPLVVESTELGLPRDAPRHRDAAQCDGRGACRPHGTRHGPRRRARSPLPAGAGPASRARAIPQSGRRGDARLAAATSLTSRARRPWQNGSGRFSQGAARSDLGAAPVREDRDGRRGIGQ